MFLCVFGAASCLAGDLVDTRLKGRLGKKALGERLEMTELVEKPADEIQGSVQIRRSRKTPDARVGKKSIAKRLRRNKTKRVVAGLR